VCSDVTAPCARPRPFPAAGGAGPGELGLSRKRRVVAVAFLFGFFFLLLSASRGSPSLLSLRLTRGAASGTAGPRRGLVFGPGVWARRGLVFGPGVWAQAPRPQRPRAGREEAAVLADSPVLYPPARLWASGKEFASPVAGDEGKTVPIYL